MNTPMSEWLIRIIFVITGLIHALPLAGLLGRSMLEQAYGIKLGEGHDLTILMQHRALLFGLLAAACFVAAALPMWRWPAGIAALISMLGLVLIAALQPHGLPIAKVMWVDAGAALLLIIGLLLHAKSPS
ncbi:MAG: phosphopantetheine adenylyltransferase [Burkholderiales bacterium]|nr:MAG: phosphopantetheine adenylyltransferase [Burkholderiales bacterium]